MTIEVRIWALTICCCLIVWLADAQTACFTVSGQVADSTGNPLRGAVVKVSSQNQASFGISNNLGKFIIDYCGENKRVAVSISYIGFATVDSILTLIGQFTNLGVVLLSSKPIVLNDVLVVKKQIEQRGDTTSFNISSYKTKNDASIEDVIRKLPGFDVDGNGAIRYNNKPIEDILIEGDALSKNYKLLSKNITPDIIDRLELIDKYAKNPVLKDVIPSSAQVINLTLKSGSRAKPIGQAKAGAGIENRYLAQLNALLLRKQFKSIAIVSGNNTGISPYEEITVDNSFAQEKNYELAAIQSPTLIPQTQLFNRNPLLASSNRNLFNQSNLLSSGSILKFKHNRSLALFSDFYSDKVSKYQTNTFVNNQDQALSFTEKLSKQIRPLQFNNQLNYTANYKAARLLVVGNYNFRNQSEQQQVISNLIYGTSLKTKTVEFGAGLFFTARFDTASAIDISVKWQSQRQYQDFDITSNTYRLIDTFKTAHQYQQADIEQTPTQAQVIYYRKLSKHVSVTASAGVNSNWVKLQSNLEIIDSTKGAQLPSGYANRRSLKYQQAKAGVGIDWAYNGFSVNLSLKAVSHGQQFFIASTPDTTTIFRGLLPSVVLSKQIGKSGRLTFQSSLENNTLDFSTLARNGVLNSYRSLSADSNVVNQVVGKTAGLTYYNRNLQKSSFLVVAYQYFDKLQNRLPSISSQKNIDAYTWFYSSAAFRFHNLYAKYDKYFKSVRTTLSIKNTSSVFSNPQFFNGIQASSSMFSNTAGITLRPGFVKNTNISLGADYYFQKDQLSKKTNYQFKYSGEASATLSSKLAVGANMRHVFSDFFVNRRSLIFSDLHAWYTLKPQKFELKFSVINVANTRQAIYGERNAAFERNNTDALLPRFVMLEFSTRF